MRIPRRKQGYVGWTRDAVIVGIPLLYACGFVAWAYYSLSQGLGFLPVAAPQYLMAGFMLGAFLAAFMGAGIASARSVRRKRTPTVEKTLESSHLPWGFWKTFGLRAGIEAAAITAFAAALLVFAAIGILRFEPAVLAVLAAFSSMILASEAWVLSRNRPAAPRQSPDSLGNRPKAADAAARQESPNSGPSPMALALWPLALLILFASMILPAVHPEFGGGMPRHAYLDIDTDRITPQTLSAIVADPSNATGIQRTVMVTVFFDKGETLLIKPTARSKPSDAIFELRWTVVAAIVWID